MKELRMYYLIMDHKSCVKLSPVVKLRSAALKCNLIKT